MAKAKAFPCVKKKTGKKTYVVIVAPGTTTFKATTGVASAHEKADPTLTWTVFKVELASNLKKMKVVFHGKQSLAASKTKGRKKMLTDIPDAGTLVITLSDPPAGIDPIVTDVPVEYVDDFD